MSRLVYSAITSLDGYVADEDGNFDWAAPDEEVHVFFNDLERQAGTYLYGRYRTPPDLTPRRGSAQRLKTIARVMSPMPPRSSRPEQPICTTV